MPLERFTPSYITVDLSETEVNLWHVCKMNTGLQSPRDKAVLDVTDQSVFVDSDDVHHGRGFHRSP